MTRTPQYHAKSTAFRIISAPNNLWLAQHLTRPGMKDNRLSPYTNIHHPIDRYAAEPHSDALARMNRVARTQGVS